MGIIDEMIDDLQRGYKDLKPYVDDAGIWMPAEYYPCHKLVMTREAFIEAYQKYILEEKK